MNTNQNAVDEWREFFRPPEVRVLLVAESHVAPLAGDEHIRVFAPGFLGRPTPKSYCRLVYCLGYGESHLCSRKPDGNHGTWQFWDMIGQIAGGMGNTQPRKALSRLHERVRWKLRTLQQLHCLGVWLVDASTEPLYQPGGTRPVQPNESTRVLRESWEYRVLPKLQRESIQESWVIGLGVGTALSGLPMIDQSRVIRQPQARDPRKYRLDLERMVHSIRARLSWIIEECEKRGRLDGTDEPTQ